MTTTKITGTTFNSKQVKVSTLSKIDFETVKWYLNKFLMKMNGSTEETAKGWVEGIGLDEETTNEIWKEITNSEETILA